MTVCSLILVLLKLYNAEMDALDLILISRHNQDVDANPTAQPKRRPIERDIRCVDPIA